jgi:hypothetical protein
MVCSPSGPAQLPDLDRGSLEAEGSGERFREYHFFISIILIVLCVSVFIWSPVTLSQKYVEINININIRRKEPMSPS